MNYTAEELLSIDEQYYLPTANRYPIVFEKGLGAKLWDVEGKEYIDALAGIAVVSLGHSHPGIVETVSEQASKLMQISNFFLSEPQALLSKKLCELSGLDYVFFGNSGAEANEGAIKIARKYAKNNGRGSNIITIKNAFHGRTMTTVAASGRVSMMRGFDPIPTGFIQASFNDIESVKNCIDDSVGGIMLEVIQGEGGIHAVDNLFLTELKELCDKENIVLVIDEIQTGIGRTGKTFAFQHYNVVPDILSLAKGLGSGFPIGAVLASRKVGSVIEKGDHATTFGGNPLACSVALKVLETIEKENLLKQCTDKGEWFASELEKVKSEFPEIKEIRGKGLMIGVELNIESKPVVVEMMNRYVIANATAGNVVRFVPPLIISYEELKQVLDVFLESLVCLRNRK